MHYPVKRWMVLKIEHLMDFVEQVHSFEKAGIRWHLENTNILKIIFVVIPQTMIILTVIIFFNTLM